MQSKINGFTLLEILIALFIFAILSLLMVGGLRTVINIEGGVSKRASDIRALQFALLIFSRDVEQTINRPITNAFGKEEASFIGTYNSFSFTHLGAASGGQFFASNGMQRTRYVFTGNTLLRMVWPVLDMAPNTISRTQHLLTGLSDVHFEYLSSNNRFYQNWPLNDQNGQVLPLAIRIFLTIPNWGKMSELYLLPTQSTTKQ